MKKGCLKIVTQRTMPLICKIINNVRSLTLRNVSNGPIRQYRPIGELNVLQQRSECGSSTLLIHSRTFCLQKTSADEETPKEIVDASKDRSKVIPVEVSIRYLLSSAYQTTYGSDPVWKHYRRNFKGQFAPRHTRKRCIRKGVIDTGSPCPICRDEYLVLHPKNTKLLNQFISPHTGAVLPYSLTGVCQRRQIELLVAIMQAKEMGLITFDLPFQKYEYSEYV